MSYHCLELLAPNKYESDLSNEVLCILVGTIGTKAAKISQVKVGG